MKIEKLYTLSQFVDIIENDGSLNFEDQSVLIFNYNDFLKQPIRKEMFVNEVEKPDKNDYDFNDKNVCYDGKGYPERCYDYDLDKWQEAEKKVIFKDGYITKYFDYHANILSTKDRLIICDTLNDLAEATNGELEINLEL